MREVNKAMTQFKNKLGKISIECMINQYLQHDIETMKVTSLELTDVGGIPHLKLDNIDPQMNIICGENGVGKTNILDSIAACFSEFDQNILSKRSGSDCGIINFEIDGSKENHLIRLNKFDPDENGYHLNNHNYRSTKNNLLYLRADRAINYKKVRAINSDPDVTHRSRFTSSGINNDDIKDWLLNRVLHSGQPDHLTDIQLENLNQAKYCFGLFNSEYSFSSLNTKNEILLNTPTGKIYFEYLSSGFKSTIFILLGVIKEIDYIFANNGISAPNYDGVILIDEVELHLHPEWQGRICDILKKVFPKAQFFITTHSPHVVQTAGENEVIALQRQADQVIQRDLPTTEYGYQGWTVEEILEDVMGMPDLRAQKYKDYKASFDKALDDNNKVAAQVAYDELDKMLHPDYPLRPVFRMQLDSLGE